MSFGLKSLRFEAHLPLLFHQRNHKLLKLFVASDRRMSEKSKAKVFVSRDDFPAEGMNLLKERCDLEIWPLKKGLLSRDELVKQIKVKDAFYIALGDKIDKELLKSAGKNFKVISTMSVGLDHIDVAAAKEAKIRIGYTPDVLTEATAELTIGLLIATSRRLFEANKALRCGDWKSWSPLWMCGPGLEGSTIGIFGFGRIGQSVAKKLLAFRVSRILYCGRKKKEGNEIGAIHTDFDCLLKESDFVIVNCSLTPETKCVFNKDKFSLMKPTSIFVNTARGGVVDQEALLEALQNKVIAGAGLDCMNPEPIPTDHPLTKLDNCVLLPHIGSATFGSRNAMGVLAAQNILAALDDREMPAEIKV
ncbi:unnamed protein product [Nezara viridula]|uniref:Glyoxylate reductase/hydroxypyruvate reductase n=1 Tax=Nezara viridula TaxID=85310 RepID=A0A9P0H7D7_NEZVI|nr:unnamed protein product [Nezara viridula]